ncbi:hypothetical protein EJ08DRAFT_119450 [Tothia fuscella]|uniref:Zn(2)-C6 fungal-type domain-containing protein n=1 Tax=Tothia fuscella TaxID=1048955 RepID=A0A9P4NDV1_9PEZI|nr:hypothetical protein EJ08DRAFT_119450 [Tothia fuscella]
MSNVERQNHNPPEIRRRRGHKKSKLGCLECKRRKIKCDEKRPACSRCILSLNNCLYPTPQLPPVTKAREHGLSTPCPSSSLLSASPNLSSYFPKSPSLSDGAREINVFDTTKDPMVSSDIDLYHHYLQHTGHTLTHFRGDKGVLQIGMPTLALKSKTVFHSILAVSAVCICCDLIYKNTPPDPETVQSLLLRGYKYFNLATEKMRESISRADPSETEVLLASSILLVPFATASQQVSHWISSRSASHGSERLLSSTPRDVSVMLRGINSTLQALCTSVSTSYPDVPRGSENEAENSSMLVESDNTSTCPAPSWNHVLFQMVATSSEGAFSRLQARLEQESLARDQRTSDSGLDACIAAFDVLCNIRNTVFSPTQSTAPPPANSRLLKILTSDTQIAPWLLAYAKRPMLPEPGQPLTAWFLSFLVQVPQHYLDLVIPLLDQRLENSTNGPENFARTNLTADQVLALDIYAHWSVLMFLVEEESWWIGVLPSVTLTGLVARYGVDFVDPLTHRPFLVEEQWWPGSMLKIMREFKGCS